MANNFLNGIQIKAPGVYTFVTQSQTRPVDPQAFRTLYLLGSSSLGNEYRNTPKLVTSATDFTNTFGTSPSLKSVRLFFRNSENYGNLYFVKVAVSAPATITLVETAGAVTPGAYPVTINGITLTLTVPASTTAAEAAADFVDLINASVLGQELNADSDQAVVTVSTINPTQSLTITENNAVMTTALTSPTVPTTSDYVYAIENSFDELMEAGFLAAPEAFESLNKASRLTVATAMENFAKNNRIQWMALLDTGAVSEISTVHRAIAEAESYTSDGHSAIYYPYLKDLEGSFVPPSTAIAAIYILRSIREGLAEPPAGVNYPIKGVTDLHYPVSHPELEVADPASLNCILNRPNYGIVIWAAKTLAPPDSLNQFVNTQIIMNIVVNTLNRSFDSQLFRSIGGVGDVFSDIQRQAISLLQQLWRDRLLYGATANDAYAILADAALQPPVALQNGRVSIFGWVVPATLTKQIFFNIRQTEIGGITAAVTTDTQDITATIEAGTAEQPEE